MNDKDTTVSFRKFPADLRKELKLEALKLDLSFNDYVLLILQGRERREGGKC
jgi:hypothetical protein